jgi:hypothetical protein
VTIVPARDGYAIESRVRTIAQTGVEMEALTAVSVAALTLYDMVKAVDKAMTITDVELVSKRGGQSGDYRDVPAAARVRARSRQNAARRYAAARQRRNSRRTPPAARGRACGRWQATGAQLMATLADLLFDRGPHPRPALGGAAARRRDWSATDVIEAVRQGAAGLLAIGLAAGDRSPSSA